MSTDSPLVAKPAIRMSLTAADTKDVLLDVEGFIASMKMATDCDHFFQSDYYPIRFCSYICVALVLLSEPKDDDVGREIRVWFACALWDCYGERPPDRLQSKSFDFSECLQEKYLFVGKKQILEGSDCLVDDCFSLLCTVSVLKKPQLASC